MSLFDRVVLTEAVVVTVSTKQFDGYRRDFETHLKKIAKADLGPKGASASMELGRYLRKLWRGLKTTLRHEAPILSTSPDQPDEIKAIVRRMSELNVHFGYTKAADYEKLKKKKVKVAGRIRELRSQIESKIGYLLDKLSEAGAAEDVDWRAKAKTEIKLGGRYSWSVQAAYTAWAKEGQGDPPEDWLVGEVAVALRRDGELRANDTEERTKWVEQYARELLGHLRAFFKVLKEVVKGATVHGRVLAKGPADKRGGAQLTIVHAPRSTQVGPLKVTNRADVDAETFDAVLAATADAVHLLKRKKMGFVLRGTEINIAMRPRKKGGGGVARDSFWGLYNLSSAKIDVSMDSRYKMHGHHDRVVSTIVHELGHHYYYKHLSQKARAAYQWHYDRATDFPSNYAKQSAVEDFAELFTVFIGKAASGGLKIGKDYRATRDGFQRFKSAVSGDKRVDVLECVSLFDRVVLTEAM